MVNKYEEGICYGCKEPVDIKAWFTATCTNEKCPNFGKKLVLQVYTLNSKLVFDEE